MGGIAAVGVLGWLLVVAVPVYAVVVASLRRREDYLDVGPLSLPERLTPENYLDALRSGFLGYLMNSAVVAAAVVALVLALAVPAAYAVVRSGTRLSAHAFRLFLLGLAIPAQAVIVPVFLLISQLRLYDTLLAVVLPTAAFCLPVCVLILTAAMRDVPEEMYEAMALDGSGPARTLVRLVLPLTRHGTSTAAVYAALQAWNGFLFPLVLTQSESRRVLPLGLYDFQDEFGTDVPGLLAAVVLSLLPALVACLFARRAVVAGLAGGGGR
ncbi:carbohydrate ABC transporter permease [Motilibacter sp. K478]|nr:carbohydrate ABC transporter permease [Motilibacter aurantiacus]